ncbi:Serine carboxypeptidase-like [Trichinella spiralis]|uniref:Serine carboxypeptidase-like n=1 Tax=Trichinella spiralis TaxID=6334 RepID=A0ABR3KZZ5_TRISP
MSSTFKACIRNFDCPQTTTMNGDAVVSALFCFYAYYFFGNWIRRQISGQSYIGRLVQTFFQIILNTISETDLMMIDNSETLDYTESACESGNKNPLTIGNKICDLKNRDEKDSPSPEPPLMTTINENIKNDTTELNEKAVEEQRTEIPSEFSKWYFSNNVASFAKQDQPTSTNTKTIRDIFFSSTKNEIIVPKSPLLKEKFKRSQHDRRIEKLIRQRQSYYKKNQRSLFTLYDKEMMNPTYPSSNILKRREPTSLIRRQNAFIRDQRGNANKSTILERSRSRCMDALTRWKSDQRSNERKTYSKNTEEKHRLPEADELKKYSNEDNNASSSFEE